VQRTENCDDEAP
jgi:hypothetical protein